MDRRKFIGTCTCCALASAGAVISNNVGFKHVKVYDRKDYIMRILEVHLAEHCNLNCKYCCNFSSIAEEEFYNLNNFEQDISRMSHLLKKQLPELSLLGGEPLLNPQINEYVKISRKYFPNTQIGITTNAILLDDMDELFWKTLSINNVHIFPSIYPVKIDWKSILNKAEKYNIGIYLRVPASINNKSSTPHGYTEKLTPYNVNKFLVTVFSKRTLIENGNGNIDNSGCVVRYVCNNLYNGKLYPCPFIAYIRHLNKKYNTNFIVTKDDYLDIYKIKNANDVKEYMKKPLLPFCKYCGKVTKGLKWENSIEHDITEWT